MLNVFDTNFMGWVGNNKMTFLLIILLAGNIYQYIEGGKRENAILDENRKLNQIIQDNEQKSIDYERNRSERLEFLLNSLSKATGDKIPK